MRKFLLLPVTAALLFFACSSDKVAGTATDTENMLTASIAGVVTRTDGSFAAHAAVRMALVPDEDDSISMPAYVEVFTDSVGSFAFDSVIADTFQLAVVDDSVEEISYQPRLSAKSREEFEKIQLSKAARFSSVLYYEEVTEPAVAVGSHFTAFMPGTPFSKSVFAGDSFSMLIPAGTWWFGFCPGDPQIIAKLQDSGVDDSMIYRVWSMDTLEVDGGDTLGVGPFLWSTTSDVDSLMKHAEEEDLSRLSGSIACKSRKECEGVEVMLVTDIYGFAFTGDSSEFVAQTATDSLGRWWLPVPEEVPYDSFRVELRNSKADKMGLSRYVMASEVKDIDDTLDVGKVELWRTSGIISSVSLVIDRRDTNQTDNCWMNSVVVGVKGTAHFVREMTCNSLSINEIPAGPNELVMYSGDVRVVSSLQASKTPLDDYVVTVSVGLPEADVLECQGMTYTPPSISSSK